MDLNSRACARSEFEANVTCPVCFELFNESPKKPKYLVSCCHTVCRVCLDRICFSGTLKQIACPICRQVSDCSRGIDSLPTNRDKLYLLKLDSFRHEGDDTVYWCFTCGKRQALTCSSRNHTIIRINHQLFNTEIPLNMKNFATHLSKQGQSIIKYRKEIAEKLEQACAWLDSHKRLIEKLRAENASRLKQLTETVDGTSATLSLQKLLLLSLNNSEMPKLNTNTEASLEEDITWGVVQELRQVERLAKSFGVSRNNSLISLPTLQHLRNELNYESAIEDSIHRWPLLLFEALNVNPNTPLCTPRLLDTKFNFGACITPNFVDSNLNESAHFNFQTKKMLSSAIPSSAGVPSKRASSTIGSVSKGLLVIRRRGKFFNTPRRAGKK